MNYQVTITGNIRYNHVDYKAGESVLVDERGLYELEAYNLIDQEIGVEEVKKTKGNASKAKPKEEANEAATQESGE